MPFKKGDPKPPNSGRKRGSRNKCSNKTEVQAAALGMLPKEFLLHVMNGNHAALGIKPNEITLEMRIDAAGKAAPYVHRKMPQVLQMSNLGDMTDDELRDFIARAESEGTRNPSGDGGAAGA